MNKGTIQGSPDKEFMASELQIQQTQPSVGLSC